MNQTFTSPLWVEYTTNKNKKQADLAPKTPSLTAKKTKWKHSETNPSLTPFTNKIFTHLNHCLRLLESS
jgi:hypothetical protein